MDRGLSCKIVWVLAAEEAMASRFECIEPPHMFMAILKFAEMSNRGLGPYASDKHSKAFFKEEQDAMCDLLWEHKIEVPENSKEIRRTMRDRLGKSDFRAEAGWVIHRSEASRRVARVAEKLAREEKSTLVKATHVFNALLDSPSKLLVKVLEDADVIAQPLDDETQV